MFEKYYKIEYPIKINKKIVFKYLSDITSSLKIKNELIENVSFFEYYKVNDTETFESIAFEVYGDSKLHYLVMLSSELFDWRNDLPLSDSELEYYINDVYANPNGIHHYIDSRSGKRTTEKYGEFSVPITNREYEEDLNESKRSIKLIKKEYAFQLDNMIKGMF